MENEGGCKGEVNVGSHGKDPEIETNDHCFIINTSSSKVRFSRIMKWMGLAMRSENIFAECKVNASPAREHVYPFTHAA